jgi:hypothetical protein
MSSVTAERLALIKGWREERRPDNFDAWVCLGGEYRDMAEVQEWATDEKKEELLSQYDDFQTWLLGNPSIIG